MTKNPKLDLRIVVNAKRSDADSIRFVGRVTYMADRDENRDGGLRNPLGFDSDDTLVALADLAITAYHNEDFGGWYGWAVEYHDAHSIDLRRAELMTKQLRKLNKAMAKLDEQFGTASDFPTYCGRVAHALGCTNPNPFGRYSKEMRANGTHYHWMNVDYLRYHLLDVVADKVPN
jgi:hypothetical protein